MINENIRLKVKILDKIIGNDNISLFVHVNPDPDAIGSAVALINFIKLNFPEKKVALIGADKIDKNRVNEYLLNQINFNYKPVNIKEFVSSSLGIVVDTPTNDRVLTKLNISCFETLRIDHHPKMETFCNLEWIDEARVASCEMIAELFMEFRDYIIDKSIINPLYVGLLADSNRFMYPNTSKRTFKIASWMFNFNFDFDEINDLLYSKSILEKKFEDKLFSKVKIKNRVGYMILKSKNIKSSKIYLLSGYKELDIWTSIYYDFKEHYWCGSIRSKNIPINKIAERYNGGGHKFAAGFKLKSKSQFFALINELDKLAQEYEKNNTKQQVIL
ncbi:MAG: bifunctional oligoribonuclease/PAP phosphatase NrnA [Ureaplasma sp.]|nr:bifunctional oligoribonuclease/PAP phosphatase NrnA [Ureaplasma sp.]